MRARDAVSKVKEWKAVFGKTKEVTAEDVGQFAYDTAAGVDVVFKALSVRQNLAYHAALHGIGRAEARVRIAEVLDQAGLTDKGGDRVSALSGGQTRRAEIARALIHRPDILLLDEATVGLDVKSRAEVLALTRRLIAEQGVSALWATHIMDEIQPDDDLVILHQGQILRRGRASNIAGRQGLTQAFLSLTGTPA